MNEETFTKNIAALFAKRSDVFTGIGDDAAALDLGLPSGKLLLAAADQVVEGVHFVPETHPSDVARKLLHRNISDIAAMGGIPTHALVTLSLNPVDEVWLEQFNKALSDAADIYQVAIIGGDVAGAPVPGKAASLTILGLVEKEKLSLRTNAKAGDHLFLTGSFGKSFPTAHHLTFSPRLAEGRFLAGDYTCAMMDVSDGLAKDLARFAADSGLSVELHDPENTIPERDGATLRQRLDDGEDYELIIAVPPEKSEQLLKEWCFPKLPLSRVGTFVADQTPGRILLDGTPIQEKGYDHFHEN